MNLGSIVFNAKDGAQLEMYPNSQTTIKAWDITIGSKQSFDNLNLDSMQDGTGGYDPSKFGYIVIANKDGISGVNFTQGAIKVNINEYFKVKETYNFKNVVLANNGGTLTSISDQVNGGSGLNASHFRDGNENDVFDLHFLDAANKQIHMNVAFNANKSFSHNLALALLDTYINRNLLLSSTLNHNAYNMSKNNGGVFALPYSNYIQGDFKANNYGLITGVNKI